MDAVRIAILGTPRAGNTWLRHLFAQIYRVPDIAVHQIGDLDWAALPVDAIVQLHWHPYPDFLHVLKRERFRVVTPARHPLDVLISYLHWALVTRADPQIFAAMPRSAAFVEYCRGPKAANFLAMSREWWRHPSAIRIRYEDLVADTAKTLTPVLADLGLPPRLPIADAVAATSLAELRRRTGSKHHFWQGKPGLWKRLLTEREAEAITDAHRDTFAELSYSCDPDPALTPAQADNTWIELAYASIGQDLEELTQTQQQLHDLSVRLDKLAPIEKALRGPLGLARRAYRWMMTHRT